MYVLYACMYCMHASIPLLTMVWKLKSKSIVADVSRANTDTDTSPNAPASLSTLRVWLVLPSGSERVLCSKTNSPCGLSFGRMLMVTMETGPMKGGLVLLNRSNSCTEISWTMKDSASSGVVSYEWEDENGERDNSGWLCTWPKWGPKHITTTCVTHSPHHTTVSLLKPISNTHSHWQCLRAGKWARISLTIDVIQTHSTYMLEYKRHKLCEIVSFLNKHITHVTLKGPIRWSVVFRGIHCLSISCARVLSFTKSHNDTGV